MLLLEGSFRCGRPFTVKQLFFMNIINTKWWFISLPKLLVRQHAHIKTTHVPCMCCLNVFCVFPGPAVPVHIPVIGVHRHCHHLHHHSPHRHRPAADAHSEVLLLGNQPPGVQWNHSQRSWYVYSAHSLHEHKGMLRRKTRVHMLTVFPSLHH